MKIHFAILLAVLSLISCSASIKETLPIDSPTEEGIQLPNANSWQTTVISDKLVYPWEIRVSAGTLIITEAGGTIVMIDSAQQFVRYKVETSAPVVHDGGSGLMGLALDEAFARSGIAYIYYTYRRGSGLTNRIARVRYDGTSWRETSLLLDGIPGHQLYNGGRLAIGPDGFLYATTGWVHENDLPQNPRSLAGKILRMTKEGQPAPENPFPSSLVYSFGHRNPQGLAWDSQQRLFASEHGESGHDEINLITPGGNYGWPLIQGDAQRSGMTRPLLHSGSSAWAPSGIAFWNEKLVVATLGTRGLYMLDQNSRKLDILATTGERVRSVAADSGRLYMITTNTSPPRLRPV